MSKTFRTIMISIAAIALCVAIIVAGSFALFTDTVVVKNHLVAGKLKATLTRTSLTKYGLNASGFIEKTLEDTTPKSFTNKSNDNVFALAVDENGNVTEKVVPGCEFVAEMRLTNEGDVAYGYYVKIIVANASEKNLAIREQMKVTVTSKEDPTKTFTKSFAEADKNGMIALGSDKQENGKNDFVGIVGIGKTAAGEAISQNFTISVMFEDLAENNAAQLQQVDFDLVVYAVQVAR